MLRTAARALGPGLRAEAEDVAQKAFAVAWLKRGSIPDDPRAWLHGTARKIARNVQRLHYHRAIRRELDGETLAEDGGVPGVELAQDLKAAMSRLQPREQELIWLACDGELGMVEIAERTGRTPQAVKQALHRARRKLRQVLDQMDGHGGHENRDQGVGVTDASDAH